MTALEQFIKKVALSDPDRMIKMALIYYQFENIHQHTRIEYVRNDLCVSRPTAAKYLDFLAEHGVDEKHRFGKNNDFINLALVELFLGVAGAP